LPNGDILFNSTRCVQTVDCWWTEVSNLYTCRGMGFQPMNHRQDADATKSRGQDARDTQGQDGLATGRSLRRLTFDQVHDNYPTVLPDGRIVYTRWEYSDRGQLFVQGLFLMNPDGTGQTGLYGNNSWFPTSLLHARGIPGTHKIVATFSGHHTRQTGKLGIVEPARGRQENAGTRLIAPVRDTPAERIDAYGQEGDLYQYPYPLSKSEFVVACAPLGWSRTPTLFKLYWVAADGRRELLAADPEISCNQPVPLAARMRPPIRANLVDYRQTTGACFLQDICKGPGLAGIGRGTVKKLRVVALDYRAAGVGWNYDARLYTRGGRQRQLGREDRAGRGRRSRRRLGLLHLACPYARLLPGDRRPGLCGANDAKLADLAAGRERFLRRVSRVQEQRASQRREAKPGPESRSPGPDVV
jgi:hypothetical protein